jgi:hypothetical protein
MPLTLDASRTVSGTIDLQSFGITDPYAAGTGLVTVSVNLEALDQGNGVSVGSDSESVLITPTQTEYPVAFTIQPNGALDRADLSGLDLRVHVEGPYAFSGFIGNSGKSFTDVPAWSASFGQSVAVSVDDPSFANAVPGRLAGRRGASRTDARAWDAHRLRAGDGASTPERPRASFTVTR